MLQRPTTSAVVATYNRRAFLPEFLDHILANHDLSEVVVAVDGSDDGSVELAEQYELEDDRVTPLWVDHQGQFGALDAGAAVAQGDVILFMDDDVIAAPDLVAAHAAHHAERRQLVVLGYMPPAIETKPSAAAFSTVLYETEYEGRCRAYDHDPDEVLLHLWAGNFSMRRSDYLDLHYSPLEAPSHSPALRMYNQDRDFGLKCRASGLQGVFDRRARAVHRHQRHAEGFLRDAYGQGACEVLLHHLHPVELGPFDLHRYERGLPAPVARLVAAVGVDGQRGNRAEALSACAITAAERAGSLRAAVAAADIARRINQRRGADLMIGILAGQTAGTTPPATS